MHQPAAHPLWLLLVVEARVAGQPRHRLLQEQRLHEEAAAAQRPESQVSPALWKQPQLQGPSRLRCCRARLSASARLAVPTRALSARLPITTPASPRLTFPSWTVAL